MSEKYLTRLVLKIHAHVERGDTPGAIRVLKGGLDKAVKARTQFIIAMGQSLAKVLHHSPRALTVEQYPLKPRP